MKQQITMLAALLLVVPATYASAANATVAASVQKQKSVVYSDIEGHFAERTIAQFTRMHMIDSRPLGQFHPHVAFDRAQFKASEKPLYLLNTTVDKKDGGVALEAGQTLAYTQQGDVLPRDGQETVAIVGSDLDENGFAKSGFLAIYGSDGTLLQKLALSGEAAHFPAGISVTDVTGDGLPDIVTDSDLRGNGGRGVHMLNAFVQQDGRFVPAQIAYPDGDHLFNLGYEVAGKQWTIKAKDGSGAWNLQLTGDQWKNFDASWIKTPYQLTIDPAYEMKADNNTLTTKHWCWVGSHANGIALLVADYRYEGGTFVLKNYRFEAPDAGMKVQHQ